MGVFGGLDRGEMVTQKSKSRNVSHQKLGEGYHEMW